MSEKAQEVNAVVRVRVAKDNRAIQADSDRMVGLAEERELFAIAERFHDESRVGEVQRFGRSWISIESNAPSGAANIVIRSRCIGRKLKFRKREIVRI